jgi:hypothetical protein
MNNSAVGAVPSSVIPRRAWYALLLTSFGQFFVIFDSTVLNVAFPTIEQDFPNVARTTLAWALTSYSIGTASLLLLAGRVAEDLATQLDLPMVTMLGLESKFFKQHYRSNWHNQGVMVKEIDVIRQQEGW